MRELPIFVILFGLVMALTTYRPQDNVVLPSEPGETQAVVTEVRVWKPHSWGWTTAGAPRKEITGLNGCLLIFESPAVGRRVFRYGKDPQLRDCQLTRPGDRLTIKYTRREGTTQKEMDYTLQLQPR